MRVEEVGVRALAPASLRTEDPDQVATLRGGPLLEVRDERSDRRHLRERASLGRRPRGPAGDAQRAPHPRRRSEEHTSELQSRLHLVCRLLLEKKKKNQRT